MDQASRLHGAVLAALASAEAAERAATPAPWFAAAQRGKMPIIGVAAVGQDPARALAVFGGVGREGRGADARLAVELRNVAAAAYAGVRDIIERHAPTCGGHPGPWIKCRDGICDVICDCCNAAWACEDYRAATRVIPALPADVELLVHPWSARQRG